MSRLKARSELPWMQHIGGRDMLVVGRRRAPAPTCSLTQISGLALYYDASVPASLTLSGSAVVQWADLSGAGRHAVTTTDARRPTYSATGWDGARPALVWSGAHALTITPTPPMAGDAGVTMLALWQSTSAAADQRMLSVSTTDLTLTRVSLAVRASDATLLGVVGRRVTTDAAVAATATRTTGTRYLHVGTVTWGTGAVMQRLSGAPAGTATLTSSGTLTGTSARAMIGSYNTADDQPLLGPVTGTSAVVAQWSRTLSASEIEWAEGCLAHAWGLSLPAGHPYQSGPPTGAP